MVKSISSVINSGFVNSFTGLARGNTSAGREIAQALSGGGASSVTISQGLRLGAQSFGNAVQNLNSLISFVNVAENTLQRIGRVTDSLIELAQEATKASTGISERRKLLGEFEDLAVEFETIVRKAKIGEREILKQGDIEELFLTLGFNQEDSESVADLFAKFLTFDNDKNLVNPEKGNTEALKVPASAFNGQTKRIEIANLTQTQVTNTAPDTGFLQQGALEAVTLTGTVLERTGASPWTLNDVDQLLAVDPSGTGGLVVESSADYLGDNPSNFKQLFFVDSAGTVITQLTNNAIADTDYLSADINQTGDAWAYVSRNSLADEVVFANNVGDITDINDHVFTVMESDSTTLNFEDVKISSDGSYVAYKEVSDSGDFKISLRDSATSTRNSSLHNQVNINVAFDFIDTDQLAIARQLGDTFNVIAYSSDSASSLLTGNLDSIDKFSAIEKNYTANSSYYFAFTDSANEQLNLYKEGSGLVSQVSITDGAPETLSLLAQVDGSESVIIGLHGTLSVDVDSEVYQFVSEGSQTITTSTRLAPATLQVGDILDSAEKLLRRPDAYRLLHDLNGLKEQIDQNLDALSDARIFVLDNIELVRAAGLAFLELSEQISSADEADDVARLLRSEIRKAPGRALAQAENLQAIAVAALTAEPEDGTG